LASTQLNIWGKEKAAEDRLVVLLLLYFVGGTEVNNGMIARHVERLGIGGLRE
jgi:hypothetical protein